MAEVENGFGRTLRSNYEFSVPGAPYVGHCQEVGSKPICMRERPIGTMQVLGGYQMLTAKFVKRLLHSVERIRRTGENSEPNEVVKIFRHRL